MSKLKQSGKSKTLARQSKGITLVALIITIIVLLILATVSIRLVMNEGIIDKSKNAVDKYSQEEVMEKIKLAYQEYQMSQYTDNPMSLQSALDNAFGTGVATVSGDAASGWKVTIGGKVYPLEANGTVGEGLEVGKVKFGNLTLGVGDQVNYDPTLNAAEGTTTYTSYSASNASSDKNSGRTSGYDSDQSFDAATYKNAGFKWRVLDVKNGKIRLIADTDVGPGDYRESATSYYLKGSAGYINGVAELNAICSIFGHGKGADSATSITVGDVNGITGYDPAIAKYNEGKWGEYGSKVKYTRGSGNALSSVATNGRTWSGNNTFTNYFADGSKTLSTLAENSSTPQITSTYYNYNPTTLDSTANAPTTGVDAEGKYNEVYKMIFGEYKAVQNSTRQFTGSGRRPSYWLASEYAFADYDHAHWGLRNVNSGDVNNTFLYNSYGYENSSYCGVRPVVSLSSNVNIQWNDTANEWQIQ